VALKGQAAWTQAEDWDGALYRSHMPSQTPVSVTAIPYYAWDNRAAGEMRVWLRRKAEG
jgi:hypothetical protein